MTVAPLVSIVVPTMNGERHLGECLASILTQSYQNLEVIIADDGSTDRTLEIVAGLRDDRVRLLPGGRHTGLHGNWARGIGAARGDYVKLVCQDDVLESECLEEQVEALEECRDAALVCCRRRIINDQSEVIIASRGLSGFQVGASPRLSDVAEVARVCVRQGGNPLGEPVGVLVRRSAVPEPAFDARWQYAIDVEFYLRCLERGPAVLDARTLCSFRVSPRQLSAALASLQAREMRSLFRDLAMRFPGSITARDVRAGARRAGLLAGARRALYFQMRMRDAFIGRRAPLGGLEERELAVLAEVMPEYS